MASKETEMSEKNRDKYSSIRKVICMMIHCIDCDDEECCFMPYCLDFQDLLVHQEECCDKKCKIRVSRCKHYIENLYINMDMYVDYMCFTCASFSLARHSATRRSSISAIA